MKEILGIDYEHVYAIVRYDMDASEPQCKVNIKKVVSTRDLAAAEVERLNAINARKRCIYFWQVTRLFKD